MGFLKFTQLEEANVVFPLLERLVGLADNNKTIIIGLVSGQGTGKTTISKFLAYDLRQLGYKVARFSIDDFYTSWTSRKNLMKKHPKNPFYQIPRGMPGTHRVNELHSVLKSATQGKPFSIPYFEKSMHNGMGDISKKCTKVKGKLDFLILEGWNVGLPQVTNQELSHICKKYKINLAKIDPNHGRKIILEKSKAYLKLWKYIDYYLMIQPESSNLHYQWRMLQERKLIKEKGEGMTPKQIKHFVNFFLPLTYVCYDKIKANAIIKVDKRHNYKLKITK
jgi:D-glycerate 3-kinase